jgi:arylsulfatase A-like enzyme
MSRIISLLLITALGGACAGALVGLLEAALITFTSNPEEYWLFPFGIFYYGLSGAVIGSAAGLVLFVVRRASRSLAFGAAAAVTLFPLGLAIARYHVVQRVFHEELATTSAKGLAVHGALLAAAAAVSAAVFFAGSILARRPSGLAVATGGVLLGLVISTGVAALVSGGGAVAAIARNAAAQRGTNAILIIADTLRADAVKNHLDRSPEDGGLARLAKDGIVFDSAYAQSSWTRPSIATILTSLYPSEHGAVHKMDPLPSRVTTLAEAFRSEGYWTAGVVTNINVAPIFNFQQGFGEYTYLEPSFYFGATDSATRLAIYKGLRVARERFFGSYIYFRNYYQDAEVLGDAVESWLSTNPPEPFFLLIHYMDPHDPYFEIPYNGRGVARVSEPNPPASRAAEYKRLYDQDVAYLDDQLAALLHGLQERGLYDDSAIILTADHGEEFQEHGGWWHGTTLYEEQVHVPLIVKRAREATPGSIETRFARTLDIAPTLMAAAGVPIPSDFTGVDLFGARAKTASLPLMAEEDLEGNVLTSLRHGDWKLIKANDDNPRGLQPLELYNLAEDPGEKRNLAGDEPEQVARLLHLLEKERRQLRR